MNKVKGGALVTAIIVLLLALASPKIGANKKVETVDVVMTQKKVNKNEIITPEDIEIVKYPKELLPEDYLAEKEAVEGFVSGHDLGEKELITTSKIFKPGSEESGISFLIPKGERAITIDVQAATGMAGLLKPRDRVDIVSVEESKSASIILENKQILAVDRNFREVENKDAPKEMYVTITLAVTPKEAVELSLASEAGINRAILRNPTDDQTVGNNTIRK